MVFILLAILAIAITSLFFMNKQEQALKNKRLHNSDYDKEYLKKIMEKTNERLKQEQEEQTYKNSIKKNYL